MHPHRSGLSAAYAYKRGHEERLQPTYKATDEAPGRYVELHCHSAFSLHEGTSLPAELVLRAKSLGYQALALTDNHSLAGAMQFAHAAKDEDLHAIIGAEVTLENESHLTLLCETPRGYANLSRLLSRANLGSPRGEPRVSFVWLAEHAQGLIALSGCRKGQVASLAEHRDLRAAVEAAARYRDVFGANAYFIELQDNLVYEDQERNQRLLAIARELGLGVVATNNIHYAVQAQHRLHDVLVAVRHHTNLEEARPYLRPNAEFYLKPPSEMERLFSDLPEAIDNTTRIAERCRAFDLTRDLGYEFPDYDSGDGRDADQFLRDKCYELAQARYVKLPRLTLGQDVVDRLDKELALIEASGRAGFFLRLWDILRYAHDKKLPVRGRGSSVGSLVCFLLGLSGIDPMRYDLAVERFLSVTDQKQTYLMSIWISVVKPETRCFVTSLRSTPLIGRLWSAPSSSIAMPVLCET